LIVVVVVAVVVAAVAAAAGPLVVAAAGPQPLAAAEGEFAAAVGPAAAAVAAGPVVVAVAVVVAAVVGPRPRPPPAVGPVAYGAAVSFVARVTDGWPTVWYRAAYGSAGAHSTASSELASSGSTWPASSATTWSLAVRVESIFWLLYCVPNVSQNSQRQFSHRPFPWNRTLWTLCSGLLFEERLTQTTITVLGTQRQTCSTALTFCFQYLSIQFVNRYVGI
jgi:hypothetical protein